MGRAPSAGEARKVYAQSEPHRGGDLLQQVELRCHLAALQPGDRRLRRAGERSEVRLGELVFLAQLADAAGELAFVPLGGELRVLSPLLLRELREAPADVCILFLSHSAP